MAIRYWLAYTELHLNCLSQYESICFDCNRNANKPLMSNNSISHAHFFIIQIYSHTDNSSQIINCSSPRVQSKVVSYQRLEKWHLIPPCLTLVNIRYVSRVKWSNPGKGVALSPSLWCSSYWKGSLLVTLDYSRQLYLYLNCCCILRSVVINNEEHVYI